MATDNKSVKQLSQQLDGLGDKIKKLYGQLSKLEKGTKEYASKQRELNKAQKEGVRLSDELYKKQSKLISSNKNHKSSIDAATKSQRQFQQTISATATSTGKAAKAQKDFGQRLTTAIGTTLRYAGAYAVINAALTVFRSLTTGAVTEAIKFEKELANLSAVAGATGEEVKKLSKNALEVAGSTKFTAIEIVGLQTELSKLGFSADDVVASTQAIANTAQALGSPLNTTAALMGKVRNQFGLLVEQTTEIGDTLVTVINESALSMDSFATAIQYVGPIANTLGLSLQQTAGAMAVLADSGFTASRIGTGLRGILTEIGKTSGDAEGSLRQLAEQNINLAEAADLVGKRNAAQLITLLKNIDAIDEANSKYYQQGRALQSASTQINTFSGQMDILNAAFREFQIEIGNTIVESDFLLDVMAVLSEKASQTSQAFKVIGNVGFRAYNESVENIVNGTDEFDEALKLAGISIEEYDKALEILEKDRLTGTLLSLNPGQFNEEYNNAVKLFDTVEGLIAKFKDSTEAKKQDIAITKGQQEAQIVYGKTVDNIIKQSLKGKNVNKEIAQTYADLEYSIDVLDGKIEKATGNRKLQLQAERNVYKQMQEQLNNSLLDEEDVLKIRTQNQSKALKLRLDEIKKQTKEEIDAINERAKVETAVAETAEERADIEAERTALVSDAYKKQAAAIRDLSNEFDTQIDKIEAAALASDDLSKVLTSEVINDLNNAFKDYSTELGALQKALKDGVIDQDNYEASVTELRNRLQTTISTFREMFGTSPELEKFFDNLIMGFDAASTKSKETKTFVESLKEELVDSLGKALETTAEAISQFNDTALENTKNRLDAEKSAIANRYETENDILKSQLDNQLITENQFRAKQKEIQRARIADENDIERKIFEAEKKRDRQNASTDYLEAVASIIPTLIAYDKTADPIEVLTKAAITGALATAAYGAELAAINKRKFFPKKFAEGGMVNGPSHEQGGVPFSVQGRGGYEMEGGEFIVNKRATAMHRDLLERINGSYRTSPRTGNYVFAQGGLVSSANNESVDYLKAIAEATTSTAIDVRKPVRAFVSSSDLRTNETERRIRDRNDKV